mmetsp:Transcript_14167/g.25346  ORF Transcript_14167/g.25346 Transcript_14167/m.25346 type:complete len:93 (-) Transcript_14167:858-1136(-)
MSLIVPTTLRRPSWEYSFQSMMFITAYVNPDINVIKTLNTIPRVVVRISNSIFRTLADPDEDTGLDIVQRETWRKNPKGLCLDFCELCDEFL